MSFVLNLAFSIVFGQTPLPRLQRSPESVLHSSESQYLMRAYILILRKGLEISSQEYNYIGVGIERCKLLLAVPRIPTPANPGPVTIRDSTYPSLFLTSIPRTFKYEPKKIMN